MSVMKKITIFIIVLLYSAAIHAQYPQTLPIDYTSFFAPTAINANGTDLERAEYATTSDAINVNQWNRSGKLTSGEGGGVSPFIENSTLSYANYIDNAVGKAIILDAAIQPSEEVSGSTFRSTIYSLTSGSQYRGQAFYLSVLVNFSSAPTSANDFLTFDANHTANSQRGRVFVKSIGGGIQFGLGYNGQPDTWSATLDLNTTHLLILKVHPVNDGDEVFSLYVNPELGKLESTSTPLATITQTAALKQIRGITIRQRSNIGGKLAGLRFSGAWADVAKATPSELTPLSTPVVGTASPVGNESFTANWTADEDAIGYDVKVYKGEDLIGTYNANGQATESLEIHGLWVNTEYTYTVIAKGDGTTSSDSDESDASPFTTGAGLTSITTDFNDGTWGTIETAQNYTSGYIGDYYLSSAVVYTGSSSSCPEGVAHTNRMGIGKNGYVTLPIVKNVGEVEIHFRAGTIGNGFDLYQTTDGINWSSGGHYPNDIAAEQVLIIPVLSSVPVKFKIENYSNGGIYIWHIITRGAATSTTWQPQATSTDWSAPANWSDGVPTTNSNVIIPISGSYPELTENTTVNSITFKKGAKLNGNGTLIATEAVKVDQDAALSAQWYSIGFPFDVETVYCEFYKEDPLGPELVAYDEDTGGDFWLESYGGNSFDFVQSIEEGQGYIIQYPTELAGKKITFISGPGVTLDNSVTSFDATGTYQLLANPSTQAITLNAPDGDKHYYIHNGTDRYVLLESGTSIVNPFESVITVLQANPALLKSSISFDETNVPTGLEKQPVLRGDQVISTRYFTIQGIEIQRPVENEIYIVKKQYASQLQETTKIIYTIK
ncbi:hypothetical protein FACS189463_2890 [Bacteroidia bacterium]|nr:hypothetical protein FACS189463_2890 [Bacteroidia bacterium]